MKNRRIMKKAIVVILTAITIVVSVIIFSVKCNKDLVYTGMLIERNHWGALNLTVELTSLLHPTPLVILGHTGTPSCTTIGDCSNKTKSIEKYYLSELYFDLPYNFLIGGDGNAYIGRGWDSTNRVRNNSIFISFIGDYNNDTLSPQMIKTTQVLLFMGVEKGKLSDNYTLVCQNQTDSTTDSPGENVYAVVKDWPHFLYGKH